MLRGLNGDKGGVEVESNTLEERLSRGNRGAVEVELVRAPLLRLPQL